MTDKVDLHVKISDKVIEQAIDNLTAFGIDLIWSIIILVIGLKLATYVTNIVKKIIDRSSIEESVASFLISSVRIGLKILVIFMAANRLGVIGTSFSAIVASIGVAVGLALQGSLSNIAGGCLILLLKPFQVGDMIREDSNGNEGTVVAIDLFYTRIQTVDNKIVVVPNGVITNNSLTNITRQDERRLDLRVGIGYQDDIGKAKQIMLNIALESEFSVRKDEIVVFVDELADSCVMLGIRVFVPTDQYAPARWSILEKIKLEFDAQGIHIPFNQMDVHLVSE